MNQRESRKCQNCQQEFWIEPEDFNFYEKIKVPTPTWCPDCRMVRRMMARNERSLYRRKCQAPNHAEDIVSIYSPETNYIVYDQTFWLGDGWDQLVAGRPYDFSKPFFAQYHELLRTTPHNNLVVRNCEGCEYGNWLMECKDCYLTFGGIQSERVMYSMRTINTKDSLDFYFCDHAELCYEDIVCERSYRLSFSQNCSGCSDSWFLYDCRDCTHCIGCVGLRRAQYRIFNLQCTPEEYQRRLGELDFGSWKNVTDFHSQFESFKQRFPRKFANITRSQNVSGDDLIDTRNCHYVFDVTAGGCENVKYSWRAAQGTKDVYDGVIVSVNTELSYESVSLLRSSRILASMAIWDSHDVSFSFNCHDSHDLFGCIGLRNKQHCILNKQYTKEEYEELVPRIIEHMNKMPYVDKKGRVYKYGEFFPPELSPFAYNETITQEYFPLTKEQAIEKGYRWRDPDIKDYKITIKTEDLPDHIKDVSDSITNEVIQCVHYRGLTSIDCNEQCTTAFKIIPEELQFYQRMNLPLPRLCPNCRHYQRLKQRNPLKLWHRKCQCAGTKSENNIYTNTIAHRHGTNHCPNEFETSYAPDRKEIVYCESCYNAEVV